MNGRPSLVALVALSAALAFAVGATAVTDIDPPDVAGGPVNTTNTSANTTGGAGGGGGAGGFGLFGPVGGIYGLVAGLFPTVNPLLLLAATALVVAGLALVGLRRHRDESDGPPEPTVTVDSDAGVDATGTGPSVPTAALDNEVYRAWREMCDRLPVPYEETATPREFAREAVAAGADAAAVERLTDLFDRVRYGAADPTEERERAARDTLAALEEGED